VAKSPPKKSKTDAIIEALSKEDPTLEAKDQTILALREHVSYLQQQIEQLQHEKQLLLAKFVFNT
jgi:polyhydroxyalkanoate synthesis regulator phasin